MIKAIETVYKGYRFRSRLEARWAVFFDALGVKWEYEREGFELEDGTRYLPDFWLPDIECGVWFEVKPSIDSDLSKPRALANALALDDPDGPIVVVGTQPGEELTALDHPHSADEQGIPCDLPLQFCEQSGGVRLVPAERIGPFGVTGKVWAAVDESRAARFEFGEQGTAA